MRRFSPLRMLVIALALMPTFGDPPAGDAISVGDSVTVSNASPEQIDRLEDAVGTFEVAGLTLPPLEIHFPANADSCGGSHGGFWAAEGVMQIRICSSENEWVYVHELAHAWERANVSDQQRDVFMGLLGLEQWRGPDTPWNERGVEWAAVVIQQGLSGLALPPVLPSETVSRLEGFELLTGRVAPTLVSWTETRDVPCHERPTALSRNLNCDCFLSASEKKHSQNDC